MLHLNGQDWNLLVDHSLSSEFHQLASTIDSTSFHERTILERHRLVQILV